MIQNHGQYLILIESYEQALRTPFPNNRNTWWENISQIKSAAQAMYATFDDADKVYFKMSLGDTWDSFVDLVK